MTDQILNISIEHSTIIRILLLGFAGFILSMLLTPVYTHFAYKHSWWKKPRKAALDGKKATMFQKLHAGKHRRNIPTMAGLIFVASVSIITLLFNLDRNETWLPLAGMAGAAIVGLLDDVINLRGTGKGVAGLPARFKFILMLGISFVGGWWFWEKLDVTSISIPFMSGGLELGWLIIPLFMLVVVATANAVNMTDGLDGLAGGLTAQAFLIYTVIAMAEQRFGVAGFSLAMAGALLSYTWFNIYPARFFMGDVGSFAIGTALGIVALLTDTVLLLPIIGAVFVAETGSVILQNISKKLRGGKKIFLISPVHHHFEAIGWPETKVTMRFWVIGQIFGVLGLVAYFVSRVS